MNIRTLLLLLLSFSFGGCTAQHKSSPFSELNGKWLVELNSKDVGLAQTVFTFETNNNTFVAYTRKGATQDILGFWKSALAKIFTDDFKNGALIHITDGIIGRSGDTLILKGIFKSAVGNYYFNGKIINDSLTARLTSASHQFRGTIAGSKSDVTLPLANYPKIVNEALDTAQNKIFNPKITQTDSWIEFEENIQDVASKAMDDVELVFAWYYFANKLPLSHFALVKIGPVEESEQEATTDTERIVLNEKSKETAILKIKSFGGTAEEMDSIFSIIKKQKYKNLIVDLRNNSGGSVEAGMAFAKNSVDTTIIGGIFLTQKWFSKHNSIPNRTEYDQFPHFSEANYNLIIEGIHNQKGLVLKVIPNKTTFQGNLFIVTNHNTASTCEPIVYSLKEANRAVVVGERTAGAMLNGEFFELSNGFSLIVPTADYYTADGYRIDQNGVKPTIETAPETAIKYVLEKLISE